LGGRLGETVRFTMAGVTSLRCDVAMCLALPSSITVRIMTLLPTLSPWTRGVVAESF